MTNSLLLKMAIEIVDLPIEHGDFPVRYVNVYRRVYPPGLWLEWEHGEMEIQPEFWGSLMFNGIFDGI